MGNPPVPYELAKLRGFPGKRRLHPGPRPPVPPEVPDPPSFLRSYAREEWLRIAPVLFRLHLLSRFDVAPLAAYCQAFGRWRCAAEALAKKDGLQVGQAMLLRIESDAAALMLKHARQFGMTPLSRARVAGGPHPPPGKFDGMIG